MAQIDVNDLLAIGERDGNTLYLEDEAYKNVARKVGSTNVRFYLHEQRSYYARDSDVVFSTAPPFTIITVMPKCWRPTRLEPEWLRVPEGL